MEDIHKTGMTSGNGCEFLNAAKLAFVRRFAGKIIPIDDLDGVMSSNVILCEPNFPVRAAPDSFEQPVIWNRWRGSFEGHRLRRGEAAGGGPEILCKRDGSNRGPLTPALSPSEGERDSGVIGRTRRQAGDGFGECHALLKHCFFSRQFPGVKYGRGEEGAGQLHRDRNEPWE